MNTTTDTTETTYGAVTDEELAQHAALGGTTITPRYGTTDAERAALRAAGYTLSDEE
jgi:hypothetical protein